MQSPPDMLVGDSGQLLPPILAKTLGSVECNTAPSTWNARSCSWPLLNPSGEVSSLVYQQLLDRKSRQRFAKSDSPYTTEDFATLADKILDKPS